MEQLEFIIDGILKNYIVQEGIPSGLYIFALL